jgi:hypothetical protein
MFCSLCLPPFTEEMLYHQILSGIGEDRHLDALLFNALLHKLE